MLTLTGMMHITLNYIVSLGTFINYGMVGGELASMGVNGNITLLQLH